MRAREVMFVVIVIVLLWVCTGCHTVDGIGQDLQDMSSRYTERSERWER